MTEDFMQHNVTKYGEGMYTIDYGNDKSFFIRGEYEISDPVVNIITRPIEYIRNKIKGLEIRLPNQHELNLIMDPISDQIKRENWFSSPDRNGQKQFVILESHIRKALTKYSPDANSKIGLIGELFLLVSFLESDPKNVEKVISSWSGFSSKSRDFIFGSSCVEVKTTTTDESTHRINNLNQVDPTDDDGGITQLFLASLSIQESQGGYSIVSLTSEILDKIDNDILRDLFLTNLRSYGINTIGYDHNRMKNWEQFNQKYTVNFCRFYNMGDENIKLIRYADLDGMTSINEKSLSYNINLDPIILGSENNPMTLTEFIDYLSDSLI